MTILICAATGKELAALAPGLLAADTEIAEMRPYRIPGLRHIFMATGVGPLNATLALGMLLPNGKIDGTEITAVLNTGLAGAFDLKQTPLCSLCLVREEIWPEYGLNDDANVLAEAFAFPQWSRKDAPDVYDRLPLTDLSAIAPGLARYPDWQSCKSLTVAGVSASHARRNRLWNTWHAQLENMEGFAAAYAAARAGLPCVEIRAVSNLVGPRENGEQNFAGALAALGDILPALNLIR